MKRLLTLLLLVPIAVHSHVVQAQARQSLPVDQRSSSLTWTGHAEVGTYSPSGSLSIREGHIVFENGALLGADLLIDMNSMTQSNADLLHHLKSSDFFDVEHYPTASIKIYRVSNGTVFGLITIKGKSAPFQSPVKVTETDGNFVISGKVRLDRTKYGIIYNSASFFSSLGNQAIRNTFEVEFQLSGKGEIPARYRS